MFDWLIDWLIDNSLSHQIDAFRRGICSRLLNNHIHYVSARQISFFWSQISFFLISIKNPFDFWWKSHGFSYPKIYKRTSAMKYNFNKVASNFIEMALQRGCSPLNLLHNFRIPLPKNTWKAPSVSWEINFEKWEKIRLDHDENIITYFFAEE